jgi:hypothetical protein
MGLFSSFFGQKRIMLLMEREFSHEQLSEILCKTCKKEKFEKLNLQFERLLAEN